MDFRVQISFPSGDILATRAGHIFWDNRDVIYLDDFSKVLQKNLMSPSPAEGKWYIGDVASSIPNGTLGRVLMTGRSTTPIPPLTCMLNLNGYYAMFVCTPNQAGVKLRLSGDEAWERLWSRYPGEEHLWRWTRLDNQHLAVKQTHDTISYQAAGLEYVRPVPLTLEMVRQLENVYSVKPTAILAGYFHRGTTPAPTTFTHGRA